MEKAADRARQGDLSYFESLASDELGRLVKRRDEDQRTLLHAAASSGSLPLVQLIADRGGREDVDAQDDEVGSVVAFADPADQAGR